nr:hypothetical protein BaRGS_034160 [Batillaria attramentaria]
MMAGHKRVQLRSMGLGTSMSSISPIVRQPKSRDALRRKNDGEDDADDVCAGVEAAEGAAGEAFPSSSRSCLDRSATMEELAEVSVLVAVWYDVGKDVDRIEEDIIGDIIAVLKVF